MSLSHYFRGRRGFIHAEFIVGLYFPAINLTCIPLNDFSDALHTSICYHTYQTTIKGTCKTLRWHSNLCIGAMKSLIYRNGTYTLTSVGVTHQHSVFYIQQTAEYFSYPPTVLTSAAVPTCTDDILTLLPSGNGSCLTRTVAIILTLAGNECSSYSFLFLDLPFSLTICFACNTLNMQLQTSSEQRPKEKKGISRRLRRLVSRSTWPEQFLL